MNKTYLMFFILFLSACSARQNTCETKVFPGSSVETCYKNGVKNGIEKIYGDKGQLINKAEWKDGKQNGQEIQYFDNGKISKITTFENDQIHGHVKAFYENGNTLFDGYYKDFCYVSYGTCYTENGTAIPLNHTYLSKCFNSCSIVFKKLN